MPTDPEIWLPLAPDEVAAVFNGLDAPWWIAGGWALDLFLGRQTREHADIEVQVLRRDQMAVREHLRRWELHKTHQPGLAPWPDGDYLERPVNQVWVRRPGEAAWSFEVMLMDTDGEEWVYRRCPSIRGRISEIGFTTGSGLPVISPEIQLLFKAHNYRDKDLQDLALVAPGLPAYNLWWLLDSLKTVYPDGHDWIELIERRKFSDG